MVEVVIVDAIRSPMARSKGGYFRHVRAESLSAHLMQQLLARNPAVNASEINDIYWGCVQQTKEQGFNIARNAALLAGLPDSVPALTVNRLCGSSMQAFHDAARAIALGDAEICLVGGVEHMGHVPMSYNADFHPALSRYMAQASALMGVTAELLAHGGISRQQQDQFALASHQKAARAQQQGAFDDERVPCLGHDAQGTLCWVDEDEVIRLDCSLGQLAALKPAFDPAQGSVTAGNASAISDGASALLVMSADKAQQLGLPPLARFVSSAVVGLTPALMGLGPVAASQQVLKKAGLTLNDISQIEINEAFAAQVLAVCHQLQLAADDPRLNGRGGAIALGHPLGCSGARLLTTLCHQLQANNGRYGLATMCIGLGQGIATIIERCE